MGDCLIALLFAEDLMKFSLASKGLPWYKKEIDFYKHYKSMSPFTEEIGEAVLAIVYHNTKDIYDCLKDLTEMGARTAILFSRYAFEAVPVYFPKGYTHERMLCYCAMLVGVGLMLFEVPTNGIPECVSEVIGTVLTGHILTGEFRKHGGYDRLSDISENILSVLEKRLAEDSKPVKN